MRPPSPRTPDPEEIATLHIEAEAKPPPSAKGPLKVLLLEDREDFRSVLHEYLASQSYQVTSVRSGIDGLREIMKGFFDLIICDMMMPKMGGEMFYWAVTRVRPATRKHFIFFTGHKNNPPNEFFFKRIKATVIYKPFKLSVLDSVANERLSKLGYPVQRRTLVTS